MKDIIHSMRNRQKIRDIVKVQNGERRSGGERGRDRESALVSDDLVFRV